ncbi:carboxylating nicotinate-nucleotide diphosphorylase [Acidobacteriota bacterium]
MDLTRKIIELALEEDLALTDITTRLTIPGAEKGIGVISACENLVVAGNWVAEKVFKTVDPDIEYTIKIEDGSEAGREDCVAEVTGSAASILQAERTALNFLQRMSGIATTTREYLQSMGSDHAVLLDTRKTMPGMRLLDKYAVRIGGGKNHRACLGDGILLKDNHIRFCGSVGEAVRRARTGCPHMMKIEVEVQDLEELQEAIQAGADIILLDNMNVEQIREAVKLADGRVTLEVSGGVVLEKLADLAATGVNFISSGALTHSVKAVDLSLELYPEGHKL